MSGKIDTSKLNNPPEEHEINVARFFADLGYNITFLCPSNIKGNFVPDIVMNGIEWEIKCPIGKGKHTIERNINKAVLQSPNIIVDLRRISLPEDQCISQ